jgi:hypothetical protein
MYAFYLPIFYYAVHFYCIFQTQVCYHMYALQILSSCLNLAFHPSVGSFIVVLGGGTLWHLQMLLQCIQYIILKFTTSTALPHSSFARIQETVRSFGEKNFEFLRSKSSVCSFMSYTFWSILKVPNLILNKKFLLSIF